MIEKILIKEFNGWKPSENYDLDQGIELKHFKILQKHSVKKRQEEILCQLQNPTYYFLKKNSSNKKIRNKNSIDIFGNFFLLKK